MRLSRRPHYKSCVAAILKARESTSGQHCSAQPLRVGTYSTVVCSMLAAEHQVLWDPKRSQRHRRNGDRVHAVESCLSWYECAGDKMDMMDSATLAFDFRTWTGRLGAQRLWDEYLAFTK